MWYELLQFIWFSNMSKLVQILKYVKMWRNTLKLSKWHEEVPTDYNNDNEAIPWTASTSERSKKGMLLHSKLEFVSWLLQKTADVGIPETPTPLASANVGIRDAPSPPRKWRRLKWMVPKILSTQRPYTRWLYKIIYKTEMKFWAVLGSRGCREKKTPNCHK